MRPSWLGISARRASKRVSDRSAANRRKNQRRIALESLEPRALLASLTVGTVVDATPFATNVSEPTISVNPANPQNVVAIGLSQDKTGLDEAVSVDGGSTWTSKLIATGAAGDLPQEDGPLGHQTATFDAFGDLYLAYVDSDGNDMDVGMSTDGGKSWSLLSKVLGMNGDLRLAVGSGGTVAPEAVWVEGQSATDLDVLATGAPISGLGKVGSFISLLEVPNSQASTTGQPAVGPNGQFAFPYEVDTTAGQDAGPGEIWVASAANGLATTSLAAPVHVTSVNIGQFDPVTPQPVDTISSFGGLVYDDSSGPHHGRLTLIKVDTQPLGNPDTAIFAETSDDNGATWSADSLVDDANLNETWTEMLPAVADDPTTGVIAVSWLDARNDTTGSGPGDTDGKPNTDVEEYTAISTDGGTTWLAPNVKLATGPSNAITDTGPHGGDNGGGDFGDYTGITFFDNQFYSAWPDNSKGLAGNPTPHNFNIAVAPVAVVGGPAATGFLQATGIPISAPAGKSFTTAVGTFTGNTLSATDANYPSSIDWGDGQFSQGTVVPLASGGFQVTGTHTYTFGGNYNVRVTALPTGSIVPTSAFTTAIISSSVNVTPPSNVVETKAFTAQLATFADPSGLPASDFTATIDWGDGTAPSTGSVQAGGSNTYIISGGHTYALGGSYTIIVSETNTVAQVTSKGAALVTVSALPLIASGSPVNGFEGNPVSALIATFTDTYPASRVPSDYSATITWGDGTTTAGTINVGAGSTYDVEGVKDYSDEGQYPIQVQITGPGTALATVTTLANVTDAPLSSTSAPVAPVVGNSFSGAVAQFTDANGLATTADFTAIIDWGDGTTGVGTVAGTAAAGFTVNGTHTYLSSGPVTVNVSIKDKGSATTSVSDNVTVSDAPIVATLGPVGSQEGSAFSGVVASFSDGNPFATLGQFSAMVKWGDGQSTAGVVQQNGAGGFNVVASHTYTTAGSYPFEADIKSTGGSTATVTGQFVVQDAPLQSQPASISASAGQVFTGTVASFSDSDPTVRTTSQYSATISWGDGTTTSGTIVGLSGNQFTVGGSHQYAAVGSKSVTVTINDAQGAKTSVTDTAVVSDSPIIATGNTISAVAGASFNGAVASFTDANLGANSTYFSAVVTWGDGIKTNATVVATGGGNFTVQGTHTFTVPGSFTTSVQISDAGGASASVGGSANVADAPLVGSPVSVSLVEGSIFSGDIANFSDANLFAIAGDFTTQIHWGDGASTAGTVLGDGQGQFNVFGTHVYINPGTFDAHVSVLHNAGSSTSVDSTATVSPAPMTASAVSFSAVAGASATVQVGKFTDSDPTLRPPSQYSASISWGDGAVTTGIIQPDPAGGFDVFGAHAYEFGVYPFAVTIQKTGGGRAQANGTATISDAAMTAGAPIGLSGGEGTVFNGLVGTFSDANPTETPSSFMATIKWGDGTSSAGTISSLAGGQFGVSGVHQYLAGNYLTSVTVTDLAGSTVTLQGSATVADLALSAAGAGLSGTEGQTLQGVVATFTDADPRTNPPSNYSAAINWGDGTTTAGVVAFDASSNHYTVTGSHAYGQGSFSITTTITDKGGSSTTATAQATLGDAALTGSPAITASTIVIEGVPFSGVLATFSDADPRPNAASNYSATITWGDHTTTLATITSDGKGNYDVSGTHTYSAGQFSVGVAIHDIGGSFTTLTEPLTVNDARLSTTGNVTISLQQGQPFVGALAHFTDADPREMPSSNFNASIDWGDGTTTAGTIVANPSGGYDVGGSHSFASVGRKTISVTINDNSSSSTAVTATATATISPAPLTGFPVPFQATSQTAFSGVIGAFADGDKTSTAGQFSASIQWGDGSSSPGVVQGFSKGVFTVSGSHAYAEGGSYSVSWSVVKSSGVTTGATEQVVVADKLFTMTAGLDPLSDSGASSSDGITNVTAPKIDGTAEPGASVSVFVERAPLPVPIAIGTAVADASGKWSITSVTLTDGVYSLFGSATDVAGRPSTPFAQLAGAGRPSTIVIDTAGPRVSGLVFVPQQHVFLVTFQDDLSGLNQASLANGANYSLSMPLVKGNPTFVTTSVVGVPGATGTLSEQVAVRFNTPAKLKKGSYVITISAAGIADLAGNTLVERFFIPKPTLGFRPGQNFVAQINFNGKTASPPQQFITPAVLTGKHKHR
jgi:hypothetical protein